ncbi:MAG TPA: hypothetical protein VF614_16985 [Chthoniobacteraceae bacterium]|jgi:hypothetical protein
MNSTLLTLEKSGLKASISRVADGPFIVQAGEIKWERPSLVTALESIGRDWQDAKSTDVAVDLRKEVVALGWLQEEPAEIAAKEPTKPVKLAPTSA